MARLRRLDAELVRRGLARSRGQAAELVAAGRVDGRRRGRHQAGHPGGRRPTPIVVRAEPDEPDYVSPRRPQAGRRAGRVRARRARLSRGAAASTPARRTGGFTDVLLRRGAARGGRGRRRLRPAGLVAAARRAGDACSTAPTSATSTPADRRPGRPRRRRPVVHLAAARAAARCAACAASGRRPRCSWSSRSSRSAGSGSARAAWSATRRCGRTPCARWRAAAAELGLGCRGVTASPLPGPSGNVEYFLWLADGRAPAGRTTGSRGPWRDRRGRPDTRRRVSVRRA